MTVTDKIKDFYKNKFKVVPSLIEGRDIGAKIHYVKKIFMVS